MTKDKERDDALIAEKKRLAYFLECKEGTLEAEAMFRRAAALLRGDEQPKPDRAFEREERYIVIKRKHLSEVSERHIRDVLNRHSVGTIECVVVEHDWPEYEPVWHLPASGGMIERRVVVESKPKRLAEAEGAQQNETDGAEAAATERAVDRAEVLARELQGFSVNAQNKGAIHIIRRHCDELRAEWEAERQDEPVCLIGKVDCDGNELVTVSKDALDRYKDQARYTYQRAEKAEARVKKLEAERPAVVVPMSAKMWAESVLNLRGAINATCEREAARFILSLDGAKGGE